MIDLTRQRICSVNAVTTRSKARIGTDRALDRVNENDECERKGEADCSKVKGMSDERLEQVDEELIDEGLNKEADLVLLPAILNDEFGSLGKISREAFKTEQDLDPTLSDVRDKANNKKSHYEIRNALIIRKTLNNRGGERIQLVVPLKFRLGVIRACHEGISSHLGEMKTKDKLLRYFFWPNAIREVENFVKTCDPCQRVGKPRDKGKAPLKRVPIIGEVFSKLSVDLVGPLPKSEKGNKYLLTVICAASRYPEALPIADIRSETIIEALMLAFSRLGFPRTIQTDLGRSLVSELTTTFLEKFGVKITHSSVCHPASNLIER